ncbi:MAG: NADH-quinone oxidoreductase subunit NuoH [Chloroflexi bacterium]|nr:NADH-quinone oxidoreductase subunit NuoH [Chloroflexota bacterium]
MAPWVVYLVTFLMGVIAIFAFMVPSQLAVIWIERRVIGRFQIRWGPNRVGPFGLLQPIADAIKVLAKEATTPAAADKWVFWLAPIATFVPAIMVYAVFPFAPGMVLSDLNVGLLYIIALSSLSAIVVFMAGWSSNNKFSLLGAMRAVAQMVSYEIPMVLSVVGVVLLAGSLQMSRIVEAQIESGAWFLLLQPLGFLLFFVCAVSELNRTPMDIMEAESEIVAGYHTEYSGMKFSLFYAAEYTNSLAVAAVITTLFLGGWSSVPWLDRIAEATGLWWLNRIVPPWAWFIGKIYFLFFVLVWLRATFPRLRIDQLMAFAWKFLLPLALANVFITGLEILVWENTAAPPPLAIPLLVVINFSLTVVLIVGWARLLGAKWIAAPSPLVEAPDA